MQPSYIGWLDRVFGYKVRIFIESDKYKVNKIVIMVVTIIMVIMGVKDGYDAKMVVQGRLCKDSYAKMGIQRWVCKDGYE